MKSLIRSTSNFPGFFVLVVFLAVVPAALASNTWYVDGVNGNDSNDCKSAGSACKTIGHAFSLASRRDSIIVEPATYTENLTIAVDLRIIGTDLATTIVDGGGLNTVVTINSGANVILSKLTIRKGNGSFGGGVDNNGTLTISNGIISGNGALYGGGIYNNGILTVNNSIISGNSATGGGGGIENFSTLTINRSTISGNSPGTNGGGVNSPGGAVTISNSTITGNTGMFGGGIFTEVPATATITNSTITANSVSGVGGGIFNYGTLIINNGTISGNSAGEDGGIWSGNDNCCFREAVAHGEVGGIWQAPAGSGSATLQNSIVSNNSGGNCEAAYGGTITSNGYDLSSDNTCKFNGPGDMNNIDPKLGKLGSNGGPTPTIPLLLGSPAIDAGNPNGCTDSNGNLLTTDQRGYPRPGREDTGGCDIGAFERQTD